MSDYVIPDDAVMNALMELRKHFPDLDDDGCQNRSLDDPICEDVECCVYAALQAAAPALVAANMAAKSTVDDVDGLVALGEAIKGMRKRAVLVSSDGAECEISMCAGSPLLFHEHRPAIRVDKKVLSQYEGTPVLDGLFPLRVLDGPEVTS